MLLLNKKKSVFTLLQETFTIFMLVILGSIIIINPFWISYNRFLHTAMELVCVFISLATFLLVWYTFEKNDQVNHLIGFGFLAVAIFDILHSLVFLSTSQDIELSIWYWIFGRFFECVILILITKDKYDVPKWQGLFCTLLIAGISSWLIYRYVSYLPALFNFQDSTAIKLILESVIILLLMYALFQIKGKLLENGIVAYSYIFNAIIFAILVELCFTFDVNSVLYGTGHLLKMICYFFFLKGIFVTAVIYPYEKLEENNEFLTNVLNDLPIGVIMYDADLKLCFANNKALKLLNCRLKDIYGYYPEDMGNRFGYINRIPQVLLNGGVVEKNILLELTTYTGRTLRLKADYFKIKDRYLVIFEDAKKEQDLGNLKLQTKTILGSINNPIIITNVDYRIIMSNSKTTELLEMEETDLLGKDFFSLFEVIKDDHRKKDTLSSQFFKSNRPENYQRIPIITMKGHKKELLLHTDQIKNIEGELIGTIIIVADYTLVNQEHEILRQNEKMIMLGQMAAGIVHEIKNPLTAIKGFSQLIKFKAEDEKALEYACFIERETDNINRFVTDFLMFAKPSPAELKETTINELIDSIKTMIDTNAFIRKINLEFAIKDGEKIVRVDVNKIRQVILNITKNAMEVVTDQKHPEIKISTDYHNQSYEVAINIYNNGKPMTEEERRNAGTPFFTTKAKGTGLGLSICYQIIKDHKGRIEIESDKKIGTSFIIFLPCRNKLKTEKELKDSNIEEEMQ